MIIQSIKSFVKLLFKFSNFSVLLARISLLIFIWSSLTWFLRHTFRLSDSYGFEISSLSNVSFLAVCFYVFIFLSTHLWITKQISSVNHRLILRLLFNINPFFITLWFNIWVINLTFDLFTFLFIFKVHLMSLVNKIVVTLGWDKNRFFLNFVCLIRFFLNYDFILNWSLFLNLNFNLFLDYRFPLSF